VEGVGRYRRLATTIDDAAGEAFDKTAKLLGLGFPGGPAVERAARERGSQGGAAAAPAGRLGRAAFLLRRPQERGAARARRGRSTSAEDIAASFQQAVVDCLVDRTARALRRRPGATALVVAGGVAANSAVRGR
jgi:N6-L-threonylcarbamoyladenine synthase